MPADTVTVNGTARDSIQKFRQVVNGPLLEQINALNREGLVLSDERNWDGRLAAEFRGKWPEVRSTLMRMKDSLEELRQQVDQITQNIMSAGGN